jgi:hypothetical protein
MEVYLTITAISYAILNIYVTMRINKAYYMKEERRKLHKKFIWIVPFLGPLIIKSFWMKKEDKELDVMTKDKRKLPKSRNSDIRPDFNSLGGGSGGSFL